MCDWLLIVLVILWSTGVLAGAERHHSQPPIGPSPLEGHHAQVGDAVSAQNTHLTKLPQHSPDHTP